MKRKTTPLIAALLLASMLFTLPAAAANAPSEPGISPYYKSVSSIAANLSITSSGKAECYGYIKVTPSTNSFTLTMTLQRLTDGSWTYVTSWATSGTGSSSLSKSYYVTHGYYYRVKLVASVSTSSGSFVEQVTSYSNSVYY